MRTGRHPGQARARGIESLIAVGQASAEAARAYGAAARWFESVDALLAAVAVEGQALAGGARSVLVKGISNRSADRLGVGSPLSLRWLASNTVVIQEQA